MSEQVVHEGYAYCGKLSVPAVVDGEHRLHSDWTIWFDKKTKGGHREQQSYAECVVEVARFASVQQFWAAFRWLKPVGEASRDTSYYVMRGAAMPMWENFRHGGCLLCKLPRHDARLEQQWHQLVAAAIGEQFDEPSVAGVAVGARAKESFVAVWLATENARARQRVTQTLTTLLGVPEQQLEWKRNAQSMEDGSTLYRTERLSLNSGRKERHSKKSRDNKQSQKLNSTKEPQNQNQNKEQQQGPQQQSQPQQLQQQQQQVK